MLSLFFKEFQWHCFTVHTRICQPRPRVPVMSDVKRLECDRQAYKIISPIETMGFNQRFHRTYSQGQLTIIRDTNPKFTAML